MTSTVIKSQLRQWLSKLFIQGKSPIHFWSCTSLCLCISSSCFRKQVVKGEEKRSNRLLTTETSLLFPRVLMLIWETVIFAEFSIFSSCQNQILPGWCNSCPVLLRTKTPYPGEWKTTGWLTSWHVLFCTSYFKENKTIIFWNLHKLLHMVKKGRARANLVYIFNWLRHFLETKMKTPSQ